MKIRTYLFIHNFFILKVLKFVKVFIIKIRNFQNNRIKIEDLNIMYLFIIQNINSNFKVIKVLKLYFLIFKVNY